GGGHDFGRLVHGGDRVGWLKLSAEFRRPFSAFSRRSTRQKSRGLRLLFFAERPVAPAPRPAVSPAGLCRPPRTAAQTDTGVHPPGRTRITAGCDVVAQFQIRRAALPKRAALPISNVMNDAGIVPRVRLRRRAVGKRGAAVGG